LLGGAETLPHHAEGLPQQDQEGSAVKDREQGVLHDVFMVCDKGDWVVATLRSSLLAFE
jgi:hypothetical protein